MQGHRSAFACAFSGKDRIVVPASEAMRTLVARMRASPKPERKALESIEIARRQFDGLIESGLRASGLVPGRPRDDVHIHEMDVDGVSLVVAEPAHRELHGGVLHVHGGGWHMGHPQALAPALAKLAAAVGAPVASVDYRLAPEHRHPAAVEDCERAALVWMRCVEEGGGHARMVIMGESAGAHLALLTTLRLRRRHGIRLAGAALTYGLYDFANELASRTVADGGSFIIDSRSCAFYPEVYLGPGTDARDAHVSPLRSSLNELADLPDALFAVGTLDPLLDDSMIMHERWTEAGNRSNLVLYEDAPHAFDLFAVPEARHLDDTRVAFARDCLSA